MASRKFELQTIPTTRHVAMLEIVLPMVLENADINPTAIHREMLAHKERLAKKGKRYTVTPKGTLVKWYSFRKFREWINKEVLEFLEKRMPIRIKKAMLVEKSYELAMKGDHNWAKIFAKITGMEIENNTYIQAGNVNIDNRTQTLHTSEAHIEALKQDLLTYREDEDASG